MVAESSDEGPPLFAVQPQFHFPNFARRWPVFGIVAVLVGGVAGANLRAPLWMYGVLVAGAFLVVAGASVLWLRVRLPDTWYSVHPARLHIRWGGPLRSNEWRPFQGIVDVDIHQTRSEQAADLGTVRFWRERKDGHGPPRRAKEVLRNVPQPQAFVDFVKPLVAKAREPRKVHAPK